MNWILDSLVGWIFGGIAMLCGLLVEVMNHSIGLNGEQTLNAFWALFMPSVRTGEGMNPWVAMQAFGYIALLGIVTFQLFKTLFAPIAKTESPWKIVFKAFLVVLGITYAKQICCLFFEIGTAPYKVIADDVAFGAGAGGAEVIDGINMAHNAINSLVDTLTFKDIGGVFAQFPIRMLSLIFSITLMCAILQQFYRLAMEIAERYVITGCLALFSPPLIACAVSDATNALFQGWVKLMSSQMILMCMSTFFMRVAVRSLTHMEGFRLALDGGGTMVEGTSYFLGYMLIAAWLRIGTQVDRHMQSMGFGVAQAGDGLWHDILAARAMAHSIRGGIMGGMAGAQALTSLNGPGGMPTSGGLRGFTQGLSRIAGNKNAMEAIKGASSCTIGGGLSALGNLAVLNNANTMTHGSGKRALRGAMMTSANTGKKIALAGGPVNKRALQSMKSQLAQTPLGKAAMRAGASFGDMSINQRGEVEGNIQHKDGSTNAFKAQLDGDGNLQSVELGGASGESALGFDQDFAKGVGGLAGISADGQEGTIEDMQSVGDGLNHGIELPSSCIDGEGQIVSGFDPTTKEMTDIEPGKTYEDANGKQFTVNEEGRLTSVGGFDVNPRLTSVGDSASKALIDQEGRCAATALGFETASGAAMGATITSPDGKSETISAQSLNDNGSAFVAEGINKNGPQAVDTALASSNANTESIKSAQAKGLLNQDGIVSDKGREFTNTNGELAQKGVSVQTQATPTEFSGSYNGAFAQAAKTHNLMGLQQKNLPDGRTQITASGKVNPDGTVSTSKAEAAVFSAAGLTTARNGALFLTDAGQKAVKDGSLSLTSQVAKGSGGGLAATGGHKALNTAINQTARAQAGSTAGGSVHTMPTGASGVIARAAVGQDGYVKNADPKLFKALQAAGMAHQDPDGRWRVRGEPETLAGKNGNVFTAAFGTCSSATGGGVTTTPSMIAKATMSADGVLSGSPQALHALAASGMAVKVGNDYLARGQAASLAQKNGGKLAVACSSTMNSTQLGTTVAARVNSAGQLSGDARAMAACTSVGLATKSADGSYKATPLGQAMAAKNGGKLEVSGTRIDPLSSTLTAKMNNKGVMVGDKGSLQAMASAGLVRKNADGSYVPTPAGRSMMEPSGDKHTLMMQEGTIAPTIKQPFQMASASYDAMNGKMTGSPQSLKILETLGMAQKNSDGSYSVTQRGKDVADYGLGTPGNLGIAVGNNFESGYHRFNRAGGNLIRTVTPNADGTVPKTDGIATKTMDDLTSAGFFTPTGTGWVATEAGREVMRLNNGTVTAQCSSFVPTKANVNTSCQGVHAHGKDNAVLGGAESLPAAQKQGYIYKDASGQYYPTEAGQALMDMTNSSSLAFSFDNQGRQWSEPVLSMASVDGQGHVHGDSAAFGALESAGLVAKSGDSYIATPAGLALAHENGGTISAAGESFNGHAGSEFAPMAPLTNAFAQAISPEGFDRGGQGEAIISSSDMSSLNSLHMETCGGQTFATASASVSRTGEVQGDAFSCAVLSNLGFLSQNADGSYSATEAGREAAWQTEQLQASIPCSENIDGSWSLGNTTFGYGAAQFDPAVAPESQGITFGSAAAVDGCLKDVDGTTYFDGSISQGEDGYVTGPATAMSVAEKMDHVVPTIGSDGGLHWQYSRTGQMISDDNNGSINYTAPLASMGFAGQQISTERASEMQDILSKGYATQDPTNNHVAYLTPSGAAAMETSVTGNNYFNLSGEALRVSPAGVVGRYDVPVDNQGVPYCAKASDLNAMLTLNSSAGVPYLVKDEEKGLMVNAPCVSLVQSDNHGNYYMTSPSGSHVPVRAASGGGWRVANASMMSTGSETASGLPIAKDGSLDLNFSTLAHSNGTWSCRDYSGNEHSGYARMISDPSQCNAQEAWVKMGSGDYLALGSKVQHGTAYYDAAANRTIPVTNSNLNTVLSAHQLHPISYNDYIAKNGETGAQRIKWMEKDPQSGLYKLVPDADFKKMSPERRACMYTCEDLKRTTFHSTKGANIHAQRQNQAHLASKKPGGFSKDQLQ